MKTLKIQSVIANNHKKSIVIKTTQGQMSLPYSRLRYPPTSYNKIVKIYVDPEIDHEGITYFLENGKEDTLHLDVFREFNKDSDYIREITLYEMTLQLQKKQKELNISIAELARKLKTSRSQINRLFDQTNQILPAQCARSLKRIYNSLFA